MMERGRQEVLTGCEEALEEANKSRKKNLFVKWNLATNMMMMMEMMGMRMRMLRRNLLKTRMRFEDGEVEIATMMMMMVKSTVMMMMITMLIVMMMNDDDDDD